MNKRALGPTQSELSRRMVTRYLERLRTMRDHPLDRGRSRPPVPAAPKELPPDPNRPVKMRRAGNSSSPLNR